MTQNKFFSITTTILSKDNLYYELSIRPYQSLTCAPQGFIINYGFWLSSLHPEGKNQVLEEVDLAIQGIKNFDIYYRIKVQNGEIKHLHLRANIIREEKGAAIRMIGASVDSTELRIKEQELKRQHRIANQSAKLAQIGEMAAGIGHEINNPLSVGMGSLELLADTLQNSNEGTLKNISRIRESFNRIAKIVAQLRLFSRMETFETSRPFNYMEVIKESVELMELRLKNIYVEFDCDAQISKIAYGNASSLSQVLINLIGNAIDALHESHKKLIKISCRSEGCKIIISVRDYGQGIPESIKDQVFDHFFTTKPKGKGTGIGLSLSKDLMQQMGGDLDLDDSVKDGACFLVTLRTGENKEISRDPIKKQVAAKARVLLLDDEDQLVEVLGLQIEMLGCEVFATTDYKVAVEKALHEHFDVIISDMNMGEYSGKDFLQELLKSGKYQKHQVNIISGGLPKIQLIEIQNLVNKVLFKPVEKSSLIEIIDRGLKGPSL